MSAVLCRAGLASGPPSLQEPVAELRVGPNMDRDISLSQDRGPEGKKHVLVSLG